MTSSNNTFGLNERDMLTLFSIFSNYPLITKVVLFGSRAKGNYKLASDIDLAIMNSGVYDQTVLRINSDLSESSLPYKVDLINYPTLTHADLKEHISRVGIPFYNRN